MKSVILGVLMLGLIEFCCVVAIVTAFAEEEPLAVPATPSTKIVVGDLESTAVNSKETRADRLSFRERRLLGLTLGNIRRVMNDLRQKGEITDDMGSATISACVANVLLEENKPAYTQLSPEFDWDSFMAFVEKIVELIMKIIGMLSYNVPASLQLAA